MFLANLLANLLRVSTAQEQQTERRTKQKEAQYIDDFMLTGCVLLLTLLDMAGAAKAAKLTLFDSHLDL